MIIGGEMFHMDSRFGAAAVEAARSARLGADDELTGVSEITDSGIAIMKIDGPLVRWWSSYAASYPAIMRDLQRLDADASIRGVVMVADSPGGSVMMCDEVCSAMDAFGKPLQVFVGGYCMSAMYRMACHADRITATSSAEIGSIGTRAALYDYSKLFGEMGVEAVAIDTGDFKSLGLRGTEITADQRRFLQEWIDRGHSGFLDSLRVRGLSADQINEVGDGRWWRSAESLSLGLIDAVGTLEDVIESMSAQSNSTTSAAAVRAAANRKGGDQMSTENSAADSASAPEPTAAPATPVAAAPAPAAAAAPATPAAAAPSVSDAAADAVVSQAATLKELRDVCGDDASSDFLLSQLDAGATASQALQAYAAQLKQDLAAVRQSASHDRASGRAPEQVRQLQAAGVSGGSDSSADPITAFERLVEDRVKGGTSRREAVLSAVSEFPERYSAYREALQSMGDHDIDRRRRRRVNRDLVAS